MPSVPGLAALATILVLAGPVLAQSPLDGKDSQPGASGQGCSAHLRAFGQSMNQDGYWLSGWQPNRSVPRAAQAGPWGDVNWPASPDAKLRALYSAADVLAGLGEQATCEAVLAKAQNLYSTSVAELRRRGVQTSKVREYRREQIGSATPVSTIKEPYRLSGLTGTDVRNGADEYLGAIEDVVVDPQTGRPCYVLIGTGGFLGIGENYVGVPWDMLSATPQLVTFVLKVSPDILDNTPKVDPSQFVGATAVQQKEKLDAYWKRFSGGGR